MAFINNGTGNWGNESMAPEVIVPLPENQLFNHEIVNSLSSIRSLAELLVDYPGLNDGDRSRFITILRDETERLVCLMGQLKLRPDTAASL
jgi:nitrogen-specific signal transduction histidine kinase